MDELELMCMKGWLRAAEILGVSKWAGKVTSCPNHSPRYKIVRWVFPYGSRCGEGI